MMERDKYLESCGDLWEGVQAEWWEDGVESVGRAVSW